MKRRSHEYSRMTLEERTQATRERAVLVGVRVGTEPLSDVEESVSELRELARTAGAEAAHCEVQNRRRLDPAYLIGKGKVQHLAALVASHDADLVVFDMDLTPAQARNIAGIVNTKVIDRTELILDIFAQHARTREGKLQVELAQLDYRLSHLVGRGEALSRLGGGIGTRGPGEQKLEVDRRRIRQRITRLKKEIDRVARTRDTQRKHRKQLELPTVAIVGYTNAGKTSLLNALTGAHGFVAEMLFATLDPRMRRATLPNNQEIILSDTVGFIRKLPHSLVAAFRATLEEVVEADVLLLVADVSHPNFRARIEAAEQVLAEIGTGDKSTIVVLNKVDRVQDEMWLHMAREEYPESVCVSAKDGTNLDGLLEQIAAQLADRREEATFAIPQSEPHILAMIRGGGIVLDEQHFGDHVVISAEVGRALCCKLSRYRT